MEIIAGIVLAIVIGVFASISRLDRDRAFYPTVMIVIAFYYALFAVMGGSSRVLALESIPIAVFVVASVAGFKYSLWFVVAALVGHGIFDAFQDQLISNPGVPVFWPPFCLAYDVVAGFYLAWLLRTNRLSARPLTMGAPVEH